MSKRKNNETNDICNLENIFKKLKLDQLEIIKPLLQKYDYVTWENNKDLHKGDVNVDLVDKYTCAYCKLSYFSRTALFDHLRTMGVDTTPRLGKIRIKKRHIFTCGGTDEINDSKSYLIKDYNCIPSGIYV